MKTLKNLIKVSNKGLLYTHTHVISEKQKDEFFCHTRLDRVSSGITFNNKGLSSAGFPLALRLAGMTGESGRSMVEMLGVLAVIGVLSVAGIAGFKNAMDKNKANTIINEAQKRATLVVPQIQLQNNANPILTEFNNNNLGYGTFDTKVYTKADNLPDGQFGIKVSGVSKEICQNILNTLGDNTIIRRLSTTDAPTSALTTCGETNTFLMVYNNDMSTNHVAGEFGYDDCPESFYQCATTHSCVATEGDCPTCESTYIGTINNGNGGFAGNVGTNRCYCEYSGYVYNATNRCQEKTITGCTSFKDCDKGEYCNFPIKSDQPFSSYNEKGTCRELGSLPTPKFITGIGNTWLGPAEMNWYSAYDWCLAQGKRMVEVEDFDCYYPGTSDKIISGGTSNTTGCCEKGKTCGENTGNISLVMKDYVLKYGSSYNAATYTASPQSDNTTHPFFVAADRQRVGGFIGYASGSRAPLCK